MHSTELLRSATRRPSVAPSRPARNQTVGHQPWLCLFGPSQSYFLICVKAINMEFERSSSRFEPLELRPRTAPRYSSSAGSAGIAPIRIPARSAAAARTKRTAASFANAPTGDATSRCVFPPRVRTRRRAALFCSRPGRRQMRWQGTVWHQSSAPFALPLLSWSFSLEPEPT